MATIAEKNTMNDFTKDELQEIKLALCIKIDTGKWGFDTVELLGKVTKLIDNYTEWKTPTVTDYE